MKSESDVPDAGRPYGPLPGPAGLDALTGVAAVKDKLGRRVVALVGMMGSGKTSIGKRLADRLGLRFVDSDGAVEQAAGMTISEIFEHHGEAYFRDGERRVITRLLAQGPCVLATGGGAFMDERTRGAIAQAGLSVWLRADHATLLQRISRRTNRPLMRTPDPAGQLQRLLDEREPIYALADVTVDSRDRPHDDVVEALMASLLAHPAPAATPLAAS